MFEILRMDYQRIADLLFPDVKQTKEEIMKTYPRRTQGVVTRFAPSPTGFLHLGAIYTSFINERFAHQQ